MSADAVVAGHVTRAQDGGEPASVAGWSVPGYTALKVLGSGGFGDVVLARHDASGTPVAIKYLRPNLLSDSRFREMFRGEAAMLASIDDPHVVQLYEYVESPSGAAIVMELVDGASVRQILASQGGTTPEAALVVLQGSLLGLAAAHARGVVHRDYKPDNVLVNGDGLSKLTDFGIAARSGDLSARGATLAYAPPEQFIGGPASPAGDVYAATATFFECLTGQPPFRGDTAAALMYQHLSEPVPMDAVPVPLRPLVAAGMAKQPEYRPADATTFVAALNEVAARAFGPDWHERGRSHLAEVALLLVALWPSGGSAAIQATAVKQIPLRHRRWRSWNRHSGAAKTAIAAGVVVAVGAIGTVAALGLTGTSHPHVTLPTIAGVSPASGSSSGGSAVTVTGTGLAGATAVYFGTAPGAITADSGTQITVTSPPGAGTVDITVTARSGTSRRIAGDRYSYIVPGPSVSGVTPDAGGTAGGTTVVITGTGLAGATAVRFGTVPGAITADSGTQITVTSPAGTGTVPITVTTPAGTSSVAAHYTYSPHPLLTQSISLDAPSSGAPGSSGLLSASGGDSGTPVLFSVDASSGAGVCQVSGNTVSYSVAGNCVIDANQAGDARYAAAPQVQRTIAVGKNGQSISFSAPSSGAPGSSGHLSATGGRSGNPVVFSAGASSGAGVCRVSGSTVTYLSAGNCVVDANQAGNTKYAAAPEVQRTIAVGKLAQSISFSAPSSGTPDGSGHLSATGGGSGEPVVFSVAASSVEVCDVSGSTVTYLAAGSCVLDANQAGNTKYAAAPEVQRTIAVSKLAQSISFTAPPSGYEEESGTLSATGGGSGEPVVFSVAASSVEVCKVSGSTVTYLAAGSCVVDANQAGNAKYAAAPEVQRTIKVELG
jgi:eukaryotic-like serine/threonine-protein kinase